jgi:hypothetical protein
MGNLFGAWSEYNDTTLLALRERVREYCDAGEAKAEKNLADDTQISNLPRWLSADIPFKKLSLTNYYRLVLHGITNRWLASDPDALYRDFCSFLEQRPHSLPDLRGPKNQELVRHYEVFRFSLLAKGAVMRGSLTLTQRPNETTIETFERSARPTGTKGQADYDPAGARYQRTGLLFPRGENKYLMISKKHDAPTEIQTTYLIEMGSHHMLHGRFSDWHGDSFYATRMVAQLLTRRLDDSEIKGIEPEDLDPGVREYLTGPMEVKDYVSSIKS